jgi:hypothetical protein
VFNKITTTSTTRAIHNLYCKPSWCPTIALDCDHCKHYNGSNVIVKCSLNDTVGKDYYLSKCKKDVKCSRF